MLESDERKAAGQAAAPGSSVQRLLDIEQFWILYNMAFGDGWTMFLNSVILGVHRHLKSDANELGR